ncbi:MAG TPA: diacylglycerol kinase family protein [Marmoricola sp.]|nr:diacylglycerol kinase family protein [Marmoricola sp.]
MTASTASPDSSSKAPGLDERARRAAAVAAILLPLAVILLVLAVILLVLAVAGRQSVMVLLLTTLCITVVLAAIYWFLADHGVRRWLAGFLAVLAPVLLVVVDVKNHLLWLVLVAYCLLSVALLLARYALRPDPDEWHLPEHPAAPPRRPFLLVNPRSGGGKAARFGLPERAAALGARVALLEPGDDVAALARAAVAEGADALAVAGGDGTQALVAQVAAECDVPLVVVAAGTRNHFALDLGLDREDPRRSLDALGADAVELRVDLGMVGGHPFVNNASFGAYAAIVQSPAYRDDKRGTTLELLPDLITGQRGPHLHVSADGTTQGPADGARDDGEGGFVMDAPQALLVSNNPYEAADIAGTDRRARLDTGRLGVLGVKVTSAWQASRLLRPRHRTGVRRAEATAVVVEADAPEIPVGVDGEAMLLPVPVRCTLLPGALRVRVPADRPGIRPPRGRLDVDRLWHLAVDGVR